jgi:hypothetical protein
LKQKAIAHLIFLLKQTRYLQRYLHKRGKEKGEMKRKKKKEKQQQNPKPSSSSVNPMNIHLTSTNSHLLLILMKKTNLRRRVWKPHSFVFWFSR